MPNKRAVGVHVHNIPVDDDLWTAVKAKAAADGLSIAEVARRSFRQYLAEARPSAVKVSYAERRPYVVADNLDDLHGPTGDTHTLPGHIDWSGNPTYDLTKPKRLATMYKTVLMEASDKADLGNHINRDVLLATWASLRLPAPVRLAWEARHPELATPPTPEK